MLLDFTFENCLSFKDEFTFSMQKTKGEEFERINTIKTEHGEFLKSAIIYGANASGKSNFIKSLTIMKFIVQYSVLPLNALNIVEPFRFVEGYENKPSKFEIDIIVKDTEYNYGFEIMKGTIIKEWLNKKIKRTTPVFLRESSDYKDIKLFGDFKNENKILEKVSKKTLFLGIAAMFNNKAANEITNWFEKLDILGIEKSEKPHSTMEYIQKNPSIKNEILRYLKAADIDIEDFEYELKHEAPDSKELTGVVQQLAESEDIKVDIKASKVSEFNTKHKMFDEEGNYTEQMVTVPFEEYQSEGTKKFFGMIGPILYSLECGGVLVIDEIDSKLHCAIIRLILRMFNSIDINKSNAQLICSTHDVLLLEEDIRRDQIWFIQKNEVSESELYCLSDFTDIRKNDNLLKKYLLGMFGAIPFKKGDI